MSKKINIAAIIYIALVYIELLSNKQGILPIEYMTKYYVGIVVVCMLSVFSIAGRRTLKLNKELIYVFKLLIVPSLLTMIYSLGLIFINGEYFSGHLSRMIGLTFYSILAGVQSFITYNYFGKRALNYTFIAVSLNYMTSMVIAFYESGTEQFVRMVTDSSYNGSVLEMHELTPIAAVFLLYFLYSFFIEKLRFRKFSMQMIFSFIILLFSMKRIVFLALFLVIIVFYIIYVLYRKAQKIGKQYNVLQIMQIMTVILIGVSFVYIFVISTGDIYTFIQSHNINSMSRGQLWRWIRPAYDFNISFLGRGIGFVSKWMDNTWRDIHIYGMTNSIGLHNDLLQLYIEIGFVGTLIYLYNYLYLNSKRILSKMGYEKSILYFTLAIFQILNWFTDVISIYYNFQWVFYLLLFSLIDSETIDEKIQTR